MQKRTTIREMRLKEKENTKLAVDSYEKSIDLNPNYIDAISNAGIVYDIMKTLIKQKCILIEHCL